MNPFDCFYGIDWSGSVQPVRTRSIAIARCNAGKTAPEMIACPASRTDVFDMILNLAEHGGLRCLIGIDCNFGYAEAIGIRQYGEAYTYQTVWKAVDTASQQDSNFSTKGYWSDNPHFWTKGKRPDGFSMPRRLTEEACGQAGLGWPESPFKMIGPKQVGKGGLCGMRMVLHLKKRLGDTISIWPFESIDQCNRAKIVITEIYPRLFIRKTGLGQRKITDNETLNQSLKALNSKPWRTDRTVTDHMTDALISAVGLRHMCEEDSLQTLFEPPSLPRQKAMREGWIFGV